MADTTDDLIYIGIKGTVIALDRGTGETRWTAPLAGSGFVNLQRDENLLLAATRGKVFCLDAATGKILWSNGLPGFGYGIATIIASGADQNTAAIAEQLQREEQQAAAATG